MVITSSGFGFEVEATAKVAKLKCAVYEVPISYYGRTYEEGKKIGKWDGIKAVWLVFKFNLFTRVESSFRNLPDRKANLGRPFPRSEAASKEQGEYSGGSPQERYQI
jgi:hypothetical protein